MQNAWQIKNEIKIVKMEFLNETYCNGMKCSESWQTAVGIVPQ